MSKKQKTVYVCQSCGHETLKWMGRCPGCGEWNRMVEETQRPVSSGSRATFMSRPESINAISLAPEMRLTSGVTEFDRTLGGGLVPGSLVLIGGDPGIGKSTLVLQVLARLAARGTPALYLSGEESAQQIKLRAQRLSISGESLLVMTGTRIEDFLEQLHTLRPGIVAVDSIQTFYTEDIPSAPGSVGQVREVAARLMTYAKNSGVPVFLVGHVTKEGAIAGPKVLEHLVDTVLYFEGDRGQLYRILRSVKNRFGSTNEIGVFEMKDSGLEAVGNPSRIFLEERPQDVPGSAVISCMEGTRPLLVEIQALVGPSPLGMPRRTAIGVDANRISLLVAVLGKRMGMELGDQDIFVNVAGGLKVDEPAADLGIVLAMMSSFLNKPLDRGLAAFGEVGLAGEIRGVSQPDMRIKESGKLGFSRCLLAQSNQENAAASKKVKLLGVASVQDVYELLFS
ncbi:MAG: DNA repair protein RadA [Desulfatiglandaceae bacterium]